MPAYEDEHGTYIMNSKDLRAVEHVHTLTQMGIDSLKIEGRTKSHYYAARTAQVYAQAIDDNTGTTLASVDGRKLGLKVNQEDAKKVAAQMAENLAAKNINHVVFDRNGYLYHGVVASFADALREAGIKL